MALRDRMYHGTSRIIVHGPHELETDMHVAVTRFASLLKNRDWGVSIGDMGDVVRIFEESGIDCIRHRWHPVEAAASDYRFGPETDLQPSAELVAERLEITDDVSVGLISWGIRLGVLTNAGAAHVFFPGHEGVLIELLSAVRHNRKRPEKFTPQRIALIGWDQGQVELIRELLDLYKASDWFQCYNTTLQHIRGAVGWLTESLL